VRVARLRSGELLALAGGLALLVLLWLEWFALRAPAAAGGASGTGWRALGWLALAVVLAAAVLAVALAAATLAERAPQLPVTLADCTIVAGALAVVLVAVRLVFQPDLGVGAPAGDVALRLPAYLGLLGALLVASGAWRALADERTTTAEARAQTERALSVRGALRPAPPARTAVAPGPPDPLADPARAPAD